MVIDLTAYRSGFCDRLRQVTFCIAVAQWRGDRVLYVREKPTETCPYRFSEVCRVEGFTVLPWSEAACGPGPHEWRMDCDTAVNLASVARHRPPDLTLEGEIFLEQWKDAYRLLRPRADLQERIEALGIDEATVGLHVRKTDKVSWRPRFRAGQVHPLECFLMERHPWPRLVRALGGTALPRRVFLASDNAQSKAFWTEKLRRKGVEVLSHPTRFDPTALRQSGAEDFIIDLFALARCKDTVGTIPSGVLPTVAWMNGRRRWHTLLGPSLLTAPEAWRQSLFKPRPPAPSSVGPGC